MLAIRFVLQKKKNSLQVKLKKYDSTAMGVFASRALLLVLVEMTAMYLISYSDCGTSFCEPLLLPYKWHAGLKNGQCDHCLNHKAWLKLQPPSPPPPHQCWCVHTGHKPTFIWRFMVIVKRMMKYMTRMGQNTGMFKASKNVHIMPISIALVAEYLHTNTGPLTSLGLHLNLHPTPSAVQTGIAMQFEVLHLYFLKFIMKTRFITCHWHCIQYGIL